ncbi:MAG: hypothetical protein IJU20_08785 [Clostridia bacterium]|nr:hypothetical protein [Clostridia bacterium]
MIRVSDFGILSDEKTDQTAAIQRLLDGCRGRGETIRFPRGTYLISGLRLYSDTTLYLESGAVLLGNPDCEAYPVFEPPAGVQMHTDMEMFPHYYGKKPWKEYRRAMISAYGEKGISILGEPGSLIDGQDCFDPNGEEGFRGPHGIFLTNCQGIELRGYTISNSGNFMHQLDTCRDVLMRDVTCQGGSDGIHLHLCDGVEIVRCLFRTGDDCVAGIGIRNLHVHHCVLNTSCQPFRIGGVHILVEDCYIYGPGYYPHRMTVVRSREEILPREAGRHNLLSMVIFFASTEFPAAEHSHDIVFRNLLVENALRILEYHGDSAAMLQAGDRLQDITFENVRFTGLTTTIHASSPAEEPLHIHLKNVTASYGPQETTGDWLDGDSPNTILTVED